jgi:hypothetical protein
VDPDLPSPKSLDPDPHRINAECGSEILIAAYENVEKYPDYALLNNFTHKNLH